MDVWVFFYGTFMSAKVLRQHGIACEVTSPAKLTGYSLSIRPRVNLTKKADDNAYGGIALIDQETLTKLYHEVKEKFGFTYYPQPILAELSDGSTRLALCFVAEDFSEGYPDPVYIGEMIQCAKKMKAPDAYLSHIASFLKKTTYSQG